LWVDRGEMSSMLEKKIRKIVGGGVGGGVFPSETKSKKHRKGRKRRMAIAQRTKVNLEKEKTNCLGTANRKG